MIIWGGRPSLFACYVFASGAAIGRFIRMRKKPAANVLAFFWRGLYCVNFGVYGVLLRHACTCMSGALFARVWLFLWRCAACFGVACYGVFAACLRFLVFCIPAEIAARAMPSKLRSMAFYSLACVYICLCRFGAFYACFCGVWRAIESGILSAFARFPFCPYSCRSR